VTTDGMQARVGSLTANESASCRGARRRRETSPPKGAPEMSVLIEGVFERRRFLELMRDFTVFGDTGAGDRQDHRGLPPVPRGAPRGRADGDRHRAEGDRKVGVIWHTQGSGQEPADGLLRRAAGARPALENPTIVVITDRNDLDDQLFGTFAMCRDLIRQTPVQADSREDLQRR
jgi:type I restriction enzyme, R subunit